MAIALKYLHHFTNIILIIGAFALATDETHFIFNGFKGSTNKLLLDGLANVLPNGLLRMTNYSIHKTSHAFYPHPITFRPNHLSFSTTFAFAMFAQVPGHSGHGIVFIISPSTNFKHAQTSIYLGILNATDNGLSSNHIFAIELDTIQTREFGDIDGNHVGIDVNNLRSVDAASASYYSDKDGVNKPLLLNSGKPMQIWIDYDGAEMVVNVTMAPLNHPRPSKSLLSKHINLSTVLLDSMYVGFSSSTGKVSNSHYILCWSWNQSGTAQELDLSKLPSLPRIKHRKLSSKQLTFLLLLTLVVLLSLLMLAGAVWFIWKKKYQEFYEPWEKEFAPNRLSYKKLYAATKGFRNSELLGVGGFGKVYKGILPSTREQVAVKRISHESKQGMKQFVAEITSMRRLRHRNLVPLLGYCRRKGELLLVYEYMPNKSLDKYLFDKVEKSNLCWPLRFKIIKGVASALIYLHEEWEQVVLHRDVKASNVLLDAEMNARLGDFGLARLYDHNIDARTTHVVGTIGYIAPEVSRTRKPTTSTDVFAFGMFLLEVGCGRRPIGKRSDTDAEALFLSDWVCDCWRRGEILEASDPRMEGVYQENEMELVLKLGLLCLQPQPESRPSMRQVIQILDGSSTLPDIASDFNPETTCFFEEDFGAMHSLPSSSGTGSLGILSEITSHTHAHIYY